MIMKVASIVISLILSVALISCKEVNPQKLETFDWGKGIYEEPFVGLLETRPSILVNSLSYPPFKRLVSDTIELNKKFEITINEECLRSNSKLALEFTDSLGKAFDGISFIVNNKRLSDNKIDIKCEEESQVLDVTIRISPILKEQLFNGFIVAKPIELDVINGINLSQEANVIATWKCEQEFGFPILLWCLWLILALIFIALIVFIIKLIIGYISHSIVLHKANANISRPNIDNDKKENREEEKVNGVKCFRVPSIMGKSKWVSEEHPLPPFQKKKFQIHNHWVWGIFPVFEGDCVTLDAYCMSEEFWNLPGQGYERQMKAASLILYKRITDNPLMQNKYTSEQIEALKKGSKNIPGYTWHHKEDWLVMQLVKREEHDNAKPHTGGSYVWNEKHFIEEYGEEWFKNRIPLKRKSLFGIIYDKLFR